MSGQSFARTGLRYVTVLVAASAVAIQRASDGIVPGFPPIFYKEIGTGTTTIIVIHGGPGLSHDYLRPEWDRLAEHARVVYYDQRGCGRSAPDRAPFTGWHDHVQDIERLVAHVQPQGPVLIAGSSWGAQLALLYTLTRPERVDGLILSAAPAWRWWEERPSGSISAEERRKLEDSVTAMLRRGQTPSEPPRITPASDPGLYGADSAFAARFTYVCDPSATIRSLRNAPTLESLRGLQVPTLLLRGDAQAVFTDGTDTIASLIAESKVATFPSTGHDPWYNAPAAFFAVVDNFLRRHDFAGERR